MGFTPSDLEQRLEFSEPPISREERLKEAWAAIGRASYYERKAQKNAEMLPYSAAVFATGAGIVVLSGLYSLALKAFPVVQQAAEAVLTYSLQP